MLLPVCYGTCITITTATATTAAAAIIITILHRPK
jgi:hypothetical protein